MIKRLISFFLVFVFLVAIPLSARYRYNPYTRKLDWYEAAGDIVLGDVGDITLTGLAAGDLLYYNGTAWVNLGIGAGATVLTVAAGIPSWQAAGAPGAHATSHEVGGADLVDHDQLTNYLAAQHLTLPNTIVAVLTDHNKAAHDALLIDADTVDGEHAAAIVTNARVKAHFPDTIANILSDHNLAVHTALGLFDASGDVDHNLTTNYAANQHVVLPNTIANVLTDHNLAAHSVATGGTGLGVYVIGDILYASGVGTLAGLADVAIGQALMSGGVGVAPVWDASPSFTGLVSSVGLTTTSTLNITTTDLTGIVIGALGTATRAIDMSGSGLAGTDTWIYNDINNYWDAAGNFVMGASISFINATQSVVSFYEGAVRKAWWNVHYTKDQMDLLVGAGVGTQLVIGDYDTSLDQDFDHADQVNPTLFIHSATAPDSDNTQWISFTHDQTDGVISTGLGSVKIDANHLVTDYNRYDYISWNDCFDHGSTVAKYGQDWDLTALNIQGNGSNTIQTNPSHITLTTDNNAIGDNEGTRTDYQIIERVRLNRTEFGCTLGQTVNTQYYMGWNTSGTNAMVAVADEYVIVFFDVSDNANWQIKVGDGATEDVFTSAIAGAATFIRQEIWVESDGTVHWAVNGTELDITGSVDNLMTASDHYLIVGQAQSVAGAAVIVAEICYVENEKTKVN